MSKSWETLSITQGQFVDYLSENLKEKNRIIFYKHNGHFGRGFAIESRYKKANVISFRDLKTKTGKNLFFRVIHIIAALCTFILNNVKEVDARTTLEVILNNMENIYLGIDKEKEYLKYLNIKKLPYKSEKIKYIIKVEEDEIDSEEDIQCLKLLCKLVETNRINTTMLLISGENLNLLNLGLNDQNQEIPLFQLNEQDIRFIAQKSNLPITETICENIELIQKLGLHFLIDNFNHITAIAEIKTENPSWCDKVDWIIKRIIKNCDISDNELFPLLEFASFFERYFSKAEIQDFKKNQLNAANLKKAYEIAIINQEKSSLYKTPTYMFDLEAFRLYFATKYFEDLEPMPEAIFQHFRKKYPFRYIPALRVLQVNSSFINYKEKQSLALIGYYSQSNQNGFVKYNDFLCIVPKDSTATAIIKLYECFKRGETGSLVSENLFVALDGLKKNVLDEIATCAGYVMILQVLKENYIYFLDIEFSSIMDELKDSILNIVEQNEYERYWKGHFKCQYIALSLEDEDTDERSSRLFLNDINKLKEDENFSTYIAENKLRDFSRIDLLAHSLGYDNAGEIIKKLYLSSEDSSVIKELARINYSAYLIENEFYHDAEKVLRKADQGFLQNINMDTYYSYLNNLFIAQLGCNDMSSKKYTTTLSELECIKISCNDGLIIENNLAIIYLQNETQVLKGIEMLKKIIEIGNPYNRFLASHNLLSYYFTQNDVKHFNEIYERIIIPKLLMSDTTFFLNKFKWLKNNMGQKDFKEFKRNLQVTSCYNNLYIMSSIERWFE